MSLIQILQESSSLDLSQLKNVMKKDERVSMLFQKDELKLQDIKDKNAFLKTLKYYILNNENVFKFIQSRDNVGTLSLNQFKEFRKLSIDDIDEYIPTRLQKFIQNIFKEFGTILKSGLSKDLKEKLKKWFNTSGAYYDFTKHEIKELKSIPELRPKKRVLIYRGLLFKDHDFLTRETYEGTLDVGNGLKFLQSIKKNKKEINLIWHNASSWTYNKKIAERFAKYGPAQSEFFAMHQFLHRRAEKREIDGLLGFVISTFADPEDILLDSNLFQAKFHLQHGNEDEVILMPGEYLCKIYKKFNISGEIIDNDTAEDKNVQDKILTIKEFNKTFEIPNELLEIVSDDYLGSAIRIMKDWDKFSKLVLNSTTTQIMFLYNKFLDFYRENLKDLTNEDFKISEIEKIENIIYLKKLITMFNQKITHSIFKEINNTTSGKKWELSAEQYRQKLIDEDIKELEKAYLTANIVKNNSSIMLFNSLIQILNIPHESSFSRMNSTQQQEIFEKILDKFYNKLNLSRSGNKTQDITTMLNLMKKAYRNNHLLNNLISIKEKCNKISMQT